MSMQRKTLMDILCNKDMVASDTRKVAVAEGYVLVSNYPIKGLAPRQYLVIYPTYYNLPGPSPSHWYHANISLKEVNGKAKDKQFLRFIGMTLREFMATPPSYRIDSLIKWYGSEDIFGSNPPEEAMILTEDLKQLLV